MEHSDFTTADWANSQAQEARRENRNLSERIEELEQEIVVLNTSFLLLNNSVKGLAETVEKLVDYKLGKYFGDKEEK